MGTRLDETEMIKELEEAKELFLSAVAQLEDTKLDHDTRDKVTSIIQDTQIHTDIALEQIQN